MDTRPLAAERVVLGRYRLGKVIGRGGTSTVHAGEDLRAGTAVAVKEIIDSGLAERALSEVRAGARLRHPAIVPVVDWGREGGALLIVSELVDGPSLAQRAASGARPSDAEAVEIARAVLAGLAHAHERGVVHRDVKPANILLDPVAGARLTDFGVARLSGEATITMTGAVIGTMAYMAPEQARGERVGAPADVYAACLVLYEMLTGSNPLTGGGPAETARRAAAAAVPPLADRRPDLPAGLARAVDAGLARDPERRPRADEVRDALRGGPGLARRARAWRHATAVASGAAAGGLAWLAATEGGLQDMRALGVAAAAGLIGAWRPRTAALGLGLAGLYLLAVAAPGAAVLVAVAGAVAMAPALAQPRLLLVPAGAPALAAIGLGPLYPAAAALLRRLPARVWMGLTGALALLVTEVASRQGGVLVSPADARALAADLDGVRSPVAAADAVAATLGTPETLIGVGVIVVAAALSRPALLAPARMRLLTTVAWALGVATALALVSWDPVGAFAAAVPAGLVLAAIAARPWRHLPRRSPHPTSATLHDPT